MCNLINIHTHTQLLQYKQRCPGRYTLVISPMKHVRHVLQYSHKKDRTVVGVFIAGDGAAASGAFSPIHRRVPFETLKYTSSSTALQHMESVRRRHHSQSQPISVSVCLCLCTSLCVFFTLLVSLNACMSGCLTCQSGLPILSTCYKHFIPIVGVGKERRTLIGPR